jgi:hypothetical protein
MTSASNDQGITYESTRSWTLEKHQAFVLDWNLDHFYDEIDEDGERVASGNRVFDAFLISEIPGRKSVRNLFWYPKYLNLPEHLEFYIYEDVLQRSDYPYNDVGWPIMSQRMLDVLLSVGDFSHQAIPLVMLPGRQAVRDGKKIIEVADDAIENHSFVTVQLLEHLDIFDWEKSICERDAEMPSLIKFGSLEKLVLRESDKELPPLFRIKGSLSNRSHVSPKARLALEAASIQGVSFNALEGLEYYYN